MSPDLKLFRSSLLGSRMNFTSLFSRLCISALIPFVYFYCKCGDAGFLIIMVFKIGFFFVTT